MWCAKLHVKLLSHMIAALGLIFCSLAEIEIETTADHDKRS